MSFLNGNCCLKLNYLICGSKKFSSKKKKINFREKSIINEICSTKRIVKEIDSLSKENNIHQTLQSNRNVNSNQNDRRMKNVVNSSSQNSSISDSTLNNQIITKEIILHRNNRSERLGLTLSYDLTSNLKTNIYIEQVDENSIAHRQGELQRGDQIIQINNHQLTNRDQAIQLVQQTSTIILQIISSQKFSKINLSRIESPITEDDSGVILGWNTDLETIHQNYSNGITSFYSLPNNYQNSSQIKSRHCLSLNDLTNLSFFQEEILKSSICSESLFEIPTDNEKGILKPLPLNNSRYHFLFDQSQFNELNSLSSKLNRRRIRQECLKEQLITTDEDKMSEFKQGKYWTKEQRKKQFHKSKRYQKRIQSIQKPSICSMTEDFNLLNRIFLRENKKELKQKPYLAVKYQQQSNIEKQKLKQILIKYPLHHPFTSISTTNISTNNTKPYRTSTIFI